MSGRTRQQKTLSNSSLLRPDAVKTLFLLLAVGLGGAGAYFGTMAKSSYSPYSAEQLQVLLEGFGEIRRPTENQLFSRDLLLAEMQRRTVFPVLVASAALAAIGAYLSRATRGSHDGANTEEGARFSASVGNPSVVLEGARNKAAALLGVTLTAPSVVIEAALAAQLESRNSDRLMGIAPDLKAMVLAQREALIKARDLLINGVTRD